MPKEVTKEELTKLEKLFNEMKNLQKELSDDMTEEEIDKKFEEIDKTYKEMNKITKPYILANWQPQTFEEYIADFGFSENNIVIEETDNKQLKVIYEEWVKLEKVVKRKRQPKKWMNFTKSSTRILINFIQLQHLKDSWRDLS